MNKTLVLLASVATFALGAPAFAADTAKYESKVKVEQDTAGNLTEKVTEKKTDTAGTTVKNEAKAEVDVDNNGTEKTVTTKSTVDPKGLFNKETTKTKDTMNKDGAVEHKKTVNGKTVEHTETNASGNVVKH